MALNPQLFPNGVPVPFVNEMFVLARDGVEFEVDKIHRFRRLSQGGRVKARGTIYISNIWMVFVASKPVGSLTAFDIPLVVPDDQHSSLFSTHTFKILFKEGGCGTFVPLFFNLISSVRQYNQHFNSESAPRVDPLQASETPKKKIKSKREDMGRLIILSAKGYVEPIAIAKKIYVDPNDPTKIFLQQPTPESQLRRRAYHPRPAENSI
ncbi:hypothetical protein BT93_J1129 [Corymbia citriodora subsp. variegata]|nr:hypothetical protein BT93_J1129 [Corymbia citriodora subsp. variegata]